MKPRVCHLRRSRTGKFLFAFILFLFFLSFFFLLSSLFHREDYENSLFVHNSQFEIGLYDLDGFHKQIDNRICKVPKLSLYNDAIRHAFHSMDTPLNCHGSNLFYLNQNVLVMNTSVLLPEYQVLDLYEFKTQKKGKRQEVKVCEFSAIERVNDDYFTYTEKVIKDDGSFNLMIKHDFMRIKCLLNSTINEDSIYYENKKRDTNASQSDKHGSEDYADNQDDGDNRNVFDDFAPDFDQFLVHVYPKPEVFQRVAKIKRRIVNADRMNVMIIGIDSLSHLSFKRKLPMTYRYIKDELTATVMSAYNIVGDGTTAALIPILTGKTEMELPEVRKNQLDSYYVDSYPFLWSEFQDNGYVTMFAEDEPSISAFNLRLNGFKNKPTDHYMRPFWQTLWNSELREKSKKYCTGAKPHHMFLLEYLYDFYSKYHNISKFSFTYFSELTHWDNNPGEYLDKDLLHYLKLFKSSGFLDNTLLVVMADHGARYSKVRHTVQGKLEERLPMLALRYPNHFKQRNPDLIQNLAINSYRLSTPFDLHETIKDVLGKYKSTSSKSKGINLLNIIPADRTCKSAHVDIHWCTCLTQSQQNANSETVKLMANQIVHHINSMTSPVRELCHELLLKTILKAYIVVPNEKVLKFVKSQDPDFRVANFSSEIQMDIAHFQITLETSPNEAKYEVTVVKHFKDGSIEVFPDISRLNHYGNQPECVEKKYPDLRKYCLCREKLG